MKALSAERTAIAKGIIRQFTQRLEATERRARIAEEALRLSMDSYTLCESLTGTTCEYHGISCNECNAVIAYALAEAAIEEES